MQLHPLVLDKDGDDCAVEDEADSAMSLVPEEDDNEEEEDSGAVDEKASTLDKPVDEVVKDDVDPVLPLMPEEEEEDAGAVEEDIYSVDKPVDEEDEEDDGEGGNRITAVVKVKQHKTTRSMIRMIARARRRVRRVRRRVGWIDFNNKVDVLKKQLLLSSGQVPKNVYPDWDLNPGIALEANPLDHSSIWTSENKRKTKLRNK